MRACVRACVCVRVRVSTSPEHWFDLRTMPFVRRCASIGPKQAVSSSASHSPRRWTTATMTQTTLTRSQDLISSLAKTLTLGDGLGPTILCGTEEPRFALCLNAMLCVSLANDNDLDVQCS